MPKFLPISQCVVSRLILFPFVADVVQMSRWEYLFACLNISAGSIVNFEDILTPASVLAISSLKGQSLSSKESPDRIHWREQEHSLPA
jgi:hypothetical protein